VEASTTNTWAWGKMDRYTTHYTAEFPVRVPPRKTLRAFASVTQGILDAPFTMYLSSKSNGVKVQTSGFWRGGSSWGFRHFSYPNEMFERR
jgi:hypothetical protein